MQKNYFIKNLFAAILLLTLSMSISSCSGFVDAVIGSTDQPSTPTKPSTTVKVESVTLDKTELTMKVGDNDVTLTATVKPDNATNIGLDWDSSDLSVATVSSLGEVHAVAEGTATITAKAMDGSGVKATCTITVEAAGISINLTNPIVGQIIGDDGKNYDEVSHTRGALPSGVTAVAKIAYLNTGGQGGIAVAIDDESEKMTYADAKAAPQSRKPVFNNASWDTILIDTWEAMSNTAGGYTNLASKFNFKKDTYWLGNKNADGTAWCIKYSNSGVNVIENASKDETHYVRLLLIF